VAGGGAGAHQAGGELVHVLFAQQQRASGLQPLDHGGAAVGGVAERRTASGGGQTHHVDVVLHAKRQAVERQRFATRMAGLDRAGVGQHVGQWPQVKPDLVVAPARDAPVHRVDQCAWCQALGGVGRAQRGNVKRHAIG